MSYGAIFSLKLCFTAVNEEIAADLAIIAVIAEGPAMSLRVLPDKTRIAPAELCQLAQTLYFKSRDANLQHDD